ncbi:MAG: glycosyltransferase family 4 protein, partial [Bacteroidota bacterium]
VSPDLLPIFTAGPVLLNVAGMVPEKNHGGLLRIFSGLRAMHPSARLVLLGTGPLEDDIRTRGNSMGLDDVVHFLGNRTDVQVIMGKSDLLLLPSLIEGLPAVILEAMAVGCPVVAYGVGGIPVVIRNRETGMLVEPGDEDSFQRAVIAVLEDHALRNTITAAAKELVRQQFDNSVIARRFEEAYRQLITSRGSR